MLNRLKSTSIQIDSCESQPEFYDDGFFSIMFYSEDETQYFACCCNNSENPKEICIDFCGDVFTSEKKFFKYDLQQHQVIFSFDNNEYVNLEISIEFKLRFHDDISTALFNICSMPKI